MKALAVVLIVAFLCQEISFAEFARFALPANIAATKEAHRSGATTIINIQDAHSSLGAQESIASILEKLVGEYDLKMVAIEGSAGYIDTSLLRTFPDQTLRRDTADALVRAGRMSGAEFFAVTSSRPVALYGVEDEPLYRQNLEEFRDLYESGKEIKQNIAGALSALDELKEMVYSPELKELEKNAALHLGGEITFNTRWESLKVLASRIGLDYSLFPELAKFVGMMEMEASLDLRKANGQRDALIDELTKTLPKAELENLILKSIAFKSGKLSMGEYHLFLQDLGKTLSIAPERYPGLAAYTDYILKYESIDLVGLFGQLSAFEDALRERLFTNDRERELFRYSRFLGSVRDMFELKLTGGEIDRLVRDIADLSPEAIGSFINKQSAGYGIRQGADRDIRRIYDEAKRGLKFYRTAERRNFSLVSNTLARMKAEGVEAAALVTGGYHSKGIGEILKGGKASYLVVLPKFDSSKGERPYAAILTKKSAPYAGLLEAGSHYLAASAYFAADSSVPEEERLGVLASDFRKMLDSALAGVTGLNERSSKEEQLIRIWSENYSRFYEDFMKEPHQRSGFTPRQPEWVEKFLLSLLRPRAGPLRAPEVVVDIVGFISPAQPHHVITASLYTLSSNLRASLGDKVDVAIYDMYADHSLTVEAVAEDIAKRRPRILGLSIAPYTLGNAKKLFDMVNSLIPESERPAVVLGNTVPHSLPEVMLRDYFPGAFVIQGEGEIPLIEFTEYISGDRPIEDVHNLIYIKDGGLVKNPRIEADLGRLASPDIAEIARLGKEGASVYLEASRGCPWGSCLFCANRDLLGARGSGNGWKPKPVKMVLKEVSELVSNSISEFCFSDEEFIGKGPEGLERAIELASGIAAISENSGKKVSFSISCRADSISDDDDNEALRARRIEMIRRLKDAGLSKVFLGIESGSQSQLDRYNKGLKIKESEDAIRTIKEAGIRLEVGFIMFDPEVTIAEIGENIGFIERNGISANISWFLNELSIRANSPFAKIYRNNPAVMLSNSPDPETLHYSYVMINPDVLRLYYEAESAFQDSAMLYYMLKSIGRRSDKELTEELSSRVSLIRRKLMDHYLSAFKELLDIEKRYDTESDANRQAVIGTLATQMVIAEELMAMLREFGYDKTAIGREMLELSDSFMRAASMRAAELIMYADGRLSPTWTLPARYTGAGNATNEMIFLIKPGGTFNNALISDMLRRIASRGYTVEAAKVFTGEEIADMGIFEKQHRFAFRVAHEGIALFSAEDRDKLRKIYDTPEFRERFGMGFGDVETVPAYELMSRYGLSQRDVSDIWTRYYREDTFVSGDLGGINKIGTSKYVVMATDGRVNGGRPFLLVNGVYLQMKELAEAGGEDTVVLMLKGIEGRSDTWKEMREEFLGDKSPLHCPEGSIRRDSFKGQMNITEAVPFWKNIAHMSSGPFEGLSEEVLWFGLSCEEAAFGRLLTENGYSAAEIEYFLTDPEITIGGATRPLFGWTEKMEPNDALIFIKKISPPFYNPSSMPTIRFEDYMWYSDMHTRKALSVADNIVPRDRIRPSSAKIIGYPVAGPERERYFAEGARLISAGKVAQVFLSGGTAGRWFGYDIPERLRIRFIADAYRLQDKMRSFAELKLGNTAWAGAMASGRIPVWIMTSNMSDSAIKAFLENNAYFGMESSDIRFYSQGDLPRMNPTREDLRSAYPDKDEAWIDQRIAENGGEGGIFRFKDGSVSKKPLGHFDAIASLFLSRELLRMLDGGIEYIHFSDSTNLGTIVDPVMLGMLSSTDRQLMHVLARKDTIFEITLEDGSRYSISMRGNRVVHSTLPERYVPVMGSGASSGRIPGADSIIAITETLTGVPINARIKKKLEKGGTLADIDGRAQIMEGFRFPKDYDQGAIPYFSTAHQIARASAILKLFGMDPESYRSATPEELLNRVSEVGSRLNTYIETKEVLDETTGDSRIAAQFSRLSGDLTSLIDTAYTMIDRDGLENACAFLPYKEREDLERYRKTAIDLLSGRVLLGASRGWTIDKVIRAIVSKSPVSNEEMIVAYDTGRESMTGMVVALRDLIESSVDVIVRARAYLMIGRIYSAHDYFGMHPGVERIYENIIIRLIRHAVRRSLKMPESPLRIPDEFLSAELVVECPVRVDLAHGGASDIFPVSYERGGRAVNIAIDLNGKPPVRVKVRRIAEPVVKIVSKDLGVERVIELKESIVDIGEREDPLRLIKASLAVSGIIRFNDPRTLGEVFREMGGGIEIETEADVPKGSGLGTSSILGAAVLDALYKISGQRKSREELVDAVLYLEQILGIGGGWQDPVGGIFGGVRDITSGPGKPNPVAKELYLSRESARKLEERIVLYDTGGGHFAGDILRKLAVDYISRSNEELKSRQRLIDIDDDVVRAIEEADIDRLGELIGKFWREWKVLNPGASNEKTESVFSHVDDLIVGGKLCGAGGGGFAVFIAKDGKREELEARLRAFGARSGGTVYRGTIDHEGLRETMKPLGVSGDNPDVYNAKEWLEREAFALRHLRYPDPRRADLELDGYDKEHYRWDLSTGYWRRKDNERLVLGTYRDIVRSGRPGDVPTEMENHVAIRMRDGYTIYAFDSHKYSLKYLKEAEDRREIARHGNEQLFIDDHPDTNTGGDIDSCVVCDMADQGWLAGSRWVYFDDIWGRGKNLLGPNRTLTDRGVSNSGCHYSRYFDMGDRPVKTRVILNIDTDATDDLGAMLEFLSEVSRRDGIMPSTVHLSTSPPNGDGQELDYPSRIDGLFSADGFGHVESCATLAEEKNLPRLFSEDSGVSATRLLVGIPASASEAERTCVKIFAEEMRSTLGAIVDVESFADGLDGFNAKLSLTGLNGIYLDGSFLSEPSVDPAKLKEMALAVNMNTAALVIGSGTRDDVERLMDRLKESLPDLAKADPDTDRRVSIDKMRLALMAAINARKDDMRRAFGGDRLSESMKELAAKSPGVAIALTERFVGYDLFSADQMESISGSDKISPFFVYGLPGEDGGKGAPTAEAAAVYLKRCGYSDAAIGRVRFIDGSGMSYGDIVAQVGRMTGLPPSNIGIGAIEKEFVRDPEGQALLLESGAVEMGGKRIYVTMNGIQTLLSIMAKFDGSTIDVGIPGVVYDQARRIFRYMPRTVPIDYQRELELYKKAIELIRASA